MQNIRKKEKDRRDEIEEVKPKSTDIAKFSKIFLREHNCTFSVISKIINVVIKPCKKGLKLQRNLNPEIYLKTSIVIDTWYFIEN